MKTRIIFGVSWFFLCLALNGTEADTVKVYGIFYRDGEPVSVTIADGKIHRIDRPADTAGFPKMYIAPGLIDIQINGFYGIDFSDQNLTLEDIRKAANELWKTGVTTFLPTVITNEQQSLINSFTRLAEALDDREIALSVPGFHLEGPYISPLQGYRGAHLEKYIRLPDWDEFSDLQQAAHQGIRLITLAPEMSGAIPFIRKCSYTGTIVSLGHHNGSSEIIKQAADAGATLCTHLGNGCANMIHRHNNPLWPQLAEDRLSATLIADGFHLTREEVQCFYRMKGVERIILVSDALDLAGLPPGDYIRGERNVILTPDVVKFPAEDVLAGAASPLSAGVSNMMSFTRCSLADAIRMASTNAANLLGLDQIGELKPGKRADIILFTIENGRIIIQRTILAGKTVYSAGK
jgi:N-acetylglucosamine-6-phosphate deacetylase